MSELITNAAERKALLKHMILQLHQGAAPEQVKSRLAALLQKIPYDDVVAVEQELIQEGLPTAEVLRLCDVYTQVLQGALEVSAARPMPPGHPVDVFIQENRALEYVVGRLHSLYADIRALTAPQELPAYWQQMHAQFNNLMDVDKHYKRKEYLLFPHLERHGITGPPTVMWGKHDETRALLKATQQALQGAAIPTLEQARTLLETTFQPASTAITEMIMKEDQILLPMCLDTLNEAEWYEIANQTPEFGFCLYDPPTTWQPAGLIIPETQPLAANALRLPSGTLTPEVILALLNTLPVDITFVDHNDKVQYFSQGAERIFARNRSILQRDVRLCHPPASVDVVEHILADFKSGKASRAPFWIQLNGRFIHIEYFALRDTAGNYVGTLEVSQDLTEKRQLTGEQRLLSYQ